MFTVRIISAILMLFTASAYVLAQVPSGDECPSISVTGPAGIVGEDENIVWVGGIKGKVPPTLRLKWSISDGEILEGQGTLEIKSSNTARIWNGGNVTATLTVEGLPSECPNAASEIYSVVVDRLIPIPVDRFSIGVTKIDRKALTNAVAELKKNRPDQMYIIEYFPSGTAARDVSKKLRMIRSFLAGTLRFDLDRVTITIADSPDGTPSTAIFRVPPGSNDPVP